MSLRVYVLCAAMLLTAIAGVCQAEETASRTVEDGGTGPYKALMVTDSSLPTHTVFRPADMSAIGADNKLPVIAWGNGACANSPWEHINFLSEVASYGFLVVAIGPMPEEGQRGGGRSTSSQLTDAIDWAIAQNSDEDSRYYNKIDTTKIAVAGMSCGGLQTLETAPDPRVTTAVICNSGILPSTGGGMPGMPALTKDHLKKLHTPTLYILGGPSDIAYNNGMDDFKRIEHVPVFVVNKDVGHGGTYGQPHGGDFAIVATAWFQWQLKGIEPAAEMFIGEPSGVSQMPGWSIEAKNTEGLSIALGGEATVETASRTIEDGGTGFYKALMVSDSSFPDYTIFRPEDMSLIHSVNKLPIMVWGNGACANSPSGHLNFLSEVASHGFLVVAIGPMPQSRPEGQRRGMGGGIGGGRRGGQQASSEPQLVQAMDWAIAQNGNPNSIYYNKIDTTKIAVAGMSCGGLQAYQAAPDPRVSTVMICNSGLFDSAGGRGGGMGGMPALGKDHLEKLHGSIIFILGGETDIAYSNGMDDFGRIKDLPAFACNLGVGHGGTYMQPHGGDFAKVASAWLQWQLKDDEDAAKMFKGEPCGVAKMEGWSVEKKNIDDPQATPSADAVKSPQLDDAKRIVVIDDIAYRSGPSEAWRLDLAMPENFGPELRPALVLVHGGGWNAGDKRDRLYRTMLLDYALKGYVTISVNYRLMREAPLPACIEDCKCAVRWLRAHADEYRVDPERIVAYGHSAGAHLVLMLGLAGPEAGLEGDGGWDEYSSSVAAVAAGSPPTELPDRFGDPVKHSPLTYVTADAVPILLIQGTADNIVRKEITDRFVAKMKEVGAKDLRYEVVEGADHGVAYDSHLDRFTNAMTRLFNDALK